MDPLRGSPSQSRWPLTAHCAGSDRGGRVPGGLSNTNVAGPCPTSAPYVTSNLAVPEPPEDGSWHATDVKAVHAVVPHCTPATDAVSEGSVVPKLTPLIVTEMPPLAGPFVGV